MLELKACTTMLGKPPTCQRKIPEDFSAPRKPQHRKAANVDEAGQGPTQTGSQLGSVVQVVLASDAQRMQQGDHHFFSRNFRASMARQWAAEESMHK